MAEIICDIESNTPYTQIRQVYLAGVEAIEKSKLYALHVTVRLILMKQLEDAKCVTCLND